MIQSRTESIHLGGGGRHHVRTAIRPSGQKRSVLLEQHAVLDERKRQQKIGKTARFLSVFKLFICFMLLSDRF